MTHLSRTQSGLDAPHRLTSSPDIHIGLRMNGCVELEVFCIFRMKYIEIYGIIGCKGSLGVVLSQCHNIYIYIYIYMRRA